MTRIVKKAYERRKDILDAARELFRTKEYDKVTMQELMEKLNIAKGTIYHYFSSKEELLEAVVEDIVDEKLKRIQEIMENSKYKNLDALDKMRMLVMHTSMEEEHEQILDTLHHSGNTKMHSLQLGSFIIKLSPIYASVIEEGVKQGIFKTDHPLECAEFLLAGIQFLTDIGFYPWSNEQLVRRMEAFPSLVESQLQAPKGSFDFLTK